MLFQQMEHLLKCLLTNTEFSGYASELPANIVQRAAAIHKQTMGQVAGQFLEKTFSAPEEATNEPEQLKEPWLSFRFTFECDEDVYQQRKKALTSIVAKRNDLIHHLLPKWNFNSIESSKEIELYLDQQKEEILPELEHLKALVKTMQEAMKEHADYLASDECGKYIELQYLKQSQLVAWFFRIAQQPTRSDGWVVLSSAASSIRQHVPEEVANLKERYGYKKLKDIILVTEFFDVTEEPTNKGGIRVLYRIKPDLKFTD
jgi:hypothetical protein